VRQARSEEDAVPMADLVRSKIGFSSVVLRRQVVVFADRIPS
jgi:hypothetical protein